MKLGNPILRIEALNSSSAARNKKADFFQTLPNQAFYCLLCKVLLNKNLRPDIGLTNGTTGIVMGFHWDDDIVRVTDADISDVTKVFIWVDFGEQYKGPTFFPSDESRKGWFPIFSHQINESSKAEISLDNSTHYSVLSRSMIPLHLAWAWIIHKAQGQTIPGKIVIDLGANELNAGQTYVAFSRCTTFSSIGINGGAPRERLMEEISNKPMLVLRLGWDQQLDELFEITKSKLSQLPELDNNASYSIIYNPVDEVYRDNI